MSSNIFESIIYKSHNQDGSLTKDGGNARVIKESCVSPKNTPTRLFEGAEDLGVVIDPDMTAEEYNNRVSSTESTETEVIDGKEVAVSDEYVDDYVLTCPICGANYFSEELVEEGICPVCNEEMNPTVQGQVVDAAEATEGEATEEEAEAEVIEDEATEDDTTEDPTEEVTTDEATEGATEEEAISEEAIEGDDNEESEEDEVIEESLVEGHCECDCDDAEEVVTVDTEITSDPEEITESADNEGTTEDSESDEYEINEKACNHLFSQFIRENYKNGDSVEFESATMRSGDLTLEGIIRFKSGNTRKFTVVSEGFKYESGRKSFKDISKTFTESTKAPFLVDMSVEGKVVTPVSMAYNYKVQESSSTYQVKGRVALTESK